MGLLEKKDTVNLQLIRHHPMVALLGCATLYQVFQDCPEWPLELFKAYLADAFGDRIWVEHEKAKPFVNNILSCIQGETTDSEKSIVRERSVKGLQDFLFEYTSSWLKGCKQIPEAKRRNGVKAISSLVGNLEIRGLVISSIEGNIPWLNSFFMITISNCLEWLKEITTQKSALELLGKLCASCKTETDMDLAIARSLFNIYTSGPSNIMNVEVLKLLLQANSINLFRGM